MKRYILILILSVGAFFAQAQRARVQSDTTKPVVVRSDSSKPKVRGELIRPIKVWRNGQSLDAESIDCTIVYDDLEGSAKVLFQLKDSANVEIANGNIDISGADYRTFNTANNRINWTYNFTIRALRLQNRNQPVN